VIAVESFARILDYLREQGHENLQQILTELSPEDLPEVHRSWFTFWQSLSGPSRNLLYEQACGRKLNKRFAK